MASWKVTRTCSRFLFFLFRPHRISNHAHTSSYAPTVLRVCISILHMNCVTVEFLFVVVTQVMEMKKVHQSLPGYTWERYPSDKYVSAVGVFLVFFGGAQLIVGHYRLATGKGKMN
jgi:hypothetical protein